LLGEPLSLGVMPPRLGHVGVGHDGAAVGQRLVVHGNDPPILPLTLVGERLPAMQQPHPERDGGLLFLGRILAPLGEIVQDFIERHSVGIEALVQLQEVPQALIVDNHLHIPIEQHDTLFDVLEDGLEGLRTPAPDGEVR
jgi:hypothetical protein